MSKGLYFRGFLVITVGAATLMAHRYPLRSGLLPALVGWLTLILLLLDLGRSQIRALQLRGTEDSHDPDERKRLLERLRNIPLGRRSDRAPNGSSKGPYRLALARSRTANSRGVVGLCLGLPGFVLVLWIFGLLPAVIAYLLFTYLIARVKWLMATLVVAGTALALFTASELLLNIRLF